MVEILGNGKVKVFLVDEGRYWITSWRGLFELDKHFKKIKEYAIRCQLYAVTPVSKDGTWPKKATSYLQNLMNSQKDLYINVHSAEGTLLEVSLHCLEEQQDTNITSTFLKKGFCRRIDGLDDETINDYESQNLDDSDHISNESDCDTKATERNPFLKAIESARETNEQTTTNLMQVNMLYVESPAKFYVHLKKMAHCVKDFLDIVGNRELDEAENAEHTRRWSAEDHCIVKTKLPDDFKFLKDELLHRGIVKAETGRGVFNVFLRDCGATLKGILSSQLRPIGGKFDEEADLATPCQLVNIAPTDGTRTWQKAAVEFFKETLANYKTISASLQEISNENRTQKALSIELWGGSVEVRGPLDPCTTSYTNISQVMVNAGYAHLRPGRVISRIKDKMKKLEGQPNWENLLQQMCEQTINLCPPESEPTLNPKNVFINDLLQFDVDDLELTTNTEAPRAYLTPSSISKSMFTAYPTYLDIDCVIYLHDADKSDALATLRVNMAQAFIGIEDKNHIDYKNCVYTAGQACVVLYHADKCFYRGVVHKVCAGGRYEVYFIDYGNTEIVKTPDLLPYAPLPELEAFASKYKIAGIAPLGGAEKHSLNALDYIHYFVIDKLVSVRVLPEDLNADIKFCHIRIGSQNLLQNLLENKYVDALKAAPDNQPIINRGDTHIHHKHKSGNWTIFKSKPTVAKSPEPSTSLQALHGKNQRKKIYREYVDTRDYKYKLLTHHEFQSGVNGSEDEQSESSTQNDEASILQQTFAESLLHEGGEEEDAMSKKVLLKRRTEQLRQNQESRATDFDFEDFCPNDTSSIMTHISGIQNFQKPIFPNEISVFKCTVIDVKSSTVVCILPHIDSFDDQEIELQRRIKYFEKQLKMPKILRPDDKCLARYPPDNEFYRALVISVNPIANKVDVLFVDFLNKETVPMSAVLPCPVELLGIPLRWFTARLSGIMVNPRMRELDVCTELKGVVMKRLLCGRVVQPERRDDYECSKSLSGTVGDEAEQLIEVELYASSYASKPVYDDLVDRRFYIRL